MDVPESGSIFGVLITFFAFMFTLIYVFLLKIFGQVLIRSDKSNLFYQVIVGLRKLTEEMKKRDEDGGFY